MSGPHLIQDYLASLAARLPARAGLAGCAGTVALDTLMIIGVALAIPAVSWVAAGAITASAGRIAVSARSLRLARAG